MLALCVVFQLSGQDVIQLKNGSFEHCKEQESNDIIYDWEDLGFPEESPPDVEPGGNLNISKKAKNGKHYLLMVTRINGTYEAVGQQLQHPLLQDSSYVFSVWLAYTTEMYDLFIGDKFVPSAPIIFRCVGYNSSSKKSEVLAQSPVVSHDKWRKYSFVLTPKQNSYDYFVIGAYYPPGRDNLRGVILVDQLSDIRKVKALEQQREEDLEVPAGDYQDTLGKTSAPFVIDVANPSFDVDESFGQFLPKYWLYIGICKTCVPTVEPGYYERRKKAADGKNYLTLLTYANGKNEGVAQKLVYPLQRDSFYAFSLSALFLDKYYTRNEKDNKVKCNSPAILRIWGFNANNREEELLAQTTVVDHPFWYEYQFLLTPKKQNYAFIAIEAWFDPKQAKPYNGHVAIDHLSPLKRLHTEQ